MPKLLIPVAMLTAFCMPGSAWALPSLELEFINSGQIVAPTDSVAMQVRVTNTGDQDLLDAVAFGNISVFFMAPDIFYNYTETLSGGFKFGPDGTFDIASGDSVVFTMATWDPWPSPGNPGDPVPLGVYTLTSSAISATHQAFTPVRMPYVVDVSNAGAFTWEVQEAVIPPNTVPIPEPATLLLVLLVATGVGVAGRRCVVKHV